MELSYFIVPIVIILYFFYSFIRPIVFTHCFVILIIGWIDTYFKIIKYNNYIILGILSFIGHLLLILPIIYFKKIYYSNKNTYILLLFAILLLFFLPYWPYILTKEEMILLYLFLFLFIEFIMLLTK